MRTFKEMQSIDTILEKALANLQVLKEKEKTYRTGKWQMLPLGLFYGDNVDINFVSNN